LPIKRIRGTASPQPRAHSPRRLRELETENSKLKRLLAEAKLDKAMLKDLPAKILTPAEARRRRS
jgi:hypothetical protein